MGDMGWYVSFVPLRMTDHRKPGTGKSVVIKTLSDICYDIFGTHDCVTVSFHHCCTSRPSWRPACALGSLAFEIPSSYKSKMPGGKEDMLLHTYIRGAG